MSVFETRAAEEEIVAQEEVGDADFASDADLEDDSEEEGGLLKKKSSKDLLDEREGLDEEEVGKRVTKACIATVLCADVLILFVLIFLTCGPLITESLMQRVSMDVVSGKITNPSEDHFNFETEMQFSWGFRLKMAGVNNRKKSEIKRAFVIYNFRAYFLANHLDLRLSLHGLPSNIQMSEMTGYLKLPYQNRPFARMIVLSSE